MADTKISALAAVASVAGTEEYAVNESGTTKKATPAQAAAYGETRLQQGVRCKDAGDQTITTATWTALAFDTETWKVGESAIHSTSTNNSRLTAQMDGEYLPFGTVQVNTDANAWEISIRVRLNGSTTESLVMYPTIESATASDNSLYNIPFLPVQLSSSDYIELEVWHSKGSNADVLSTRTTFGMYLLGR